MCQMCQPFSLVDSCGESLLCPFGFSAKWVGEHKNRQRRGCKLVAGETAMALMMPSLETHGGRVGPLNQENPSSLDLKPIIDTGFAAGVPPVFVRWLAVPILSQWPEMLADFSRSVLLGDGSILTFPAVGLVIGVNSQGYAASSDPDDYPLAYRIAWLRPGIKTLYLNYIILLILWLSPPHIM